MTINTLSGDGCLLKNCSLAFVKEGKVLSNVSFIQKIKTKLILNYFAQTSLNSIFKNMDELLEPILMYWL